MKTVTCRTCRKRFQTPVFRGRTTCTPACEHEYKRKLGLLQAEAYRIEQDKKRKAKAAKSEPGSSRDERTAQFQRQMELKISAVIGRPVSHDGIRRIKCECCQRRVELVPSVAGSVWLKSHRGLDGQRCDGSRHVVKYHEGSEVLTED